jgi:PAS domain S-box-containing protein
MDKNAYWEKIVNTINDGLMLINPDGTIKMVNKAFETITGYNADEVNGVSCKILGCDICERARDTSDEKTWCKMFQLEQNEIKKSRCRMKRKDGTFVPVLKTASVLRENDVVEGVVETITDLSEITMLDEKVHILSKQSNKIFSNIIGKSDKMQRVFDMIQKAGDSNAPVLILGESGTGKELVANALHLHGSRKNGPFIQLNCAALNETVLESELFGHVRGAFTGAYSHRIGRFEAANKGDFFLDEIGDIPLSLQTKLLRVLESGQFERVGDITPVKADVRIITATNQNLEKLIDQNLFRQDLFFRINVIPIELPSLRNRKEDIPLLISHFIQHLNRETGKSIKGIGKSAMELFLDYHWPGNVRELKNAMEYAFVTTVGSIVELENLPNKFSKDLPLEVKTIQSLDNNKMDEKNNLIEALKMTGGNQTKAAELLQVNRVTVWNRMRKYGIDLKKVLSV